MIASDVKFIMNGANSDDTIKLSILYWKWLARSYEGKEYPNKRNIVVGNDV
jgi:hypothetical protein